MLNNVDEVDDEDVYSPHEVFDALKAKHWVIPADEQVCLFYVLIEFLTHLFHFKQLISILFCLVLLWHEILRSQS